MPDAPIPRPRARRNTMHAWLRATVAAPPDGCALFPGSLSPKGYGQIRARGRCYGAHVIAYELANGPVPDGLWVLHHCLKSRSCCNPRHLYAGTVADNAADAVRDGTIARGARHGSQTHPERVARGERSGAHTHPDRRGGATGDRHGTKTHPERVARGEAASGATLTEAQVLAIRARYAAGGVTYRALGAEFGVSHVSITKIVNRKTWSHL